MDSTSVAPKKRSTYGSLLSDGTLIEAVFNPAKRPSIFFLMKTPNGSITEVSSFTNGEEAFIPPTCDLNVISGNTVTLASGTEEFGTPSQLIEDIYDFLGKTVDLEPFHLRLMAHWILMTYAFGTWDAVPYLRFKGEPGTGKTRCLNVLHNSATEQQISELRPPNPLCSEHVTE